MLSRKSMEAITLLHHFPKLSAHTLPWPADWGAIFGTSGQNRPLILEIGFGMGHMLRHLSQQHPHANIIGIEISNMCLEKAEEMQARGDLPNVRVMFGRAETALNHLFTPDTLSEIHINFPDPWFKSRHGRRRLMQRDTLDAMVSRLIPGGYLYLATDIIEYAEMSAELLAETPALTNLHASPWVTEVEGRTITKYERRALDEGRTCHYFAYQRRRDFDALPVPVLTEKPMPHMVIRLPLTPSEIYAHFAHYKITEGETAVNFIRAYVSDEALLVEMFVHEPTIEQRVALMLSLHRDEAHVYTLRLSEMGNPRPTDGIHLAVKHLGEWLLSLHPQSETIQHKVRT